MPTRDILTSILAHEVRNALGPIKLAAELLQLDSADPAARAASAQRINRQVRHIERIIENVLARSQSELGTLELHREVCDLTMMVNAAVDNYRDITAQRGIELTCSVADMVRVSGDETRLMQVLENLLHNACKYTRSGGTIRVRLFRRAPVGMAEIEISDDGIGVAPDRLAGIFDEYVRLDSRRAGDATGLGLGLSMVKRIIDLHGGSVSVSSPGPNMGTTFCVALPMPTSEIAET